MDSYVREVFPERLKALRDAIGASQEEMAAKLGMKRQSISLYEKGLRLPDIQVFDAICQATGCDPEYLLGYQEEMNGRYTGVADRLMIDEEALSILEGHGNENGFHDMLKLGSFWNLLYFIRKYLAGNVDLENHAVHQYDKFNCYMAFDELLEEAYEQFYDGLPEEEKQRIMKEWEREIQEENERWQVLKDGLFKTHMDWRSMKPSQEVIEWRQQREERILSEIKTDKFTRFQAKLNNWPAWQRYQKEAGEHDAPQAD